MATWLELLLVLGVLIGVGLIYWTLTYGMEIIVRNEDAKRERKARRRRA